MLSPGPLLDGKQQRTTDSLSLCVRVNVQFIELAISGVQQGMGKPDQCQVLMRNPPTVSGVLQLRENVGSSVTVRQHRIDLRL